MSSDVRQNAADPISVTGRADHLATGLSEIQSHSDAADIRALAEQAEAQAAEAEALAFAARARAQAIQLRREALLAEAKAPSQATKGDADVAESSREEPTKTNNAADITFIEPDLCASLAEQEVDRPRRIWIRRFNRSTLAASVAVVVILAAMSGSLWIVLHHRQVARQRQHAAEFAAAARQGVVTLTSMDFGNAKQSVQHILDDATGSFKDDFLKTADDFVKVVEQAKVVEQGTVQAVAVDRTAMTNDSAVVLVSATSEVTNAAGAKQDPRSYRLIVTISRDGGQLKMSKVEFVP